MRNFSGIENVGPWRPGSLAEDWQEVKKKIAGGGKTSEIGTVQTMGQFANNRLWGFQVKFLKYLQELSWFITPS
jgi:hypothetical protein